MIIGTYRIGPVKTYSLVLITGVLCGLASPLSAGQSFASVYPQKPVRIVVPYAPGGNADLLGREIARHLTELWKTPFIVDNRPGAGSLLGVGMVANAAPDGYTLALTTSAAMAVAPALGIKTPFDPVKSFSPVGLVAYTPFALTVTGTLPVNSVGELLAIAKASPGKINYASPGVGTPNHLGGEMLSAVGGVKMVHIPYKGSGPALVDVLSGQVQIMFAGVPQVIPHVKSGKLKVIAVGHASRLKALPDVPTVSETLPHFDNSSWQGLLAPAGTSKAIVSKLNRALTEMFQAPDVAARLDSVGVEAATSSPDGFQKMIGDELLRWKKVVEMTGVKVSDVN